MNPAQLYTLIKSPVVSEKSTNLAQYNQVYVFKVDKSATKEQLKKAFELAFDVNVVKITTIRQKGKAKRFRGRMGKQADFKKAFVKLAEGQVINITSPA